MMLTLIELMQSLMEIIHDTKIVPSEKSREFQRLKIHTIPYIKNLSKLDIKNLEIPHIEKNNYPIKTDVRMIMPTS